MLELISELKTRLSELINREFGVSGVEFVVLPTTSLEFGDLYTNVSLVLSKVLKKAPMEIGKQLMAGLKDPAFEVSLVAPGFINFKLSDSQLLAGLREAFSNSNFAKSAISSVLGYKKAIVEYSSPNIAKPFGIGHLRSTIIGDVAANLLEYSGVEVIRDNHLGDWGTQFGKLIYAILEWGNENDLAVSQTPIKDLFDLYVKFHSEAEKEPQLEEEGRSWFKKLEDGDEEARRLWRTCIELSLKEFNRIYELLGVKFDIMLGESFFEDKMEPIIEELTIKNLLTESDGAQLVFFAKDKYPPIMILKKDGATLYATRDLATDKYRLSNYGDDILIINEVGAEQSLYFTQLIELEVMLGWIRPDQKRHLKHGLYRFKDRKMSTRRGDVVWLDDIINTAIQKASSFNQTVAKEVAIGAIKWNDLKTEPHKDVIFDWDDMLNLKGNTGPYIQYTKARAHSIASKTEKTNLEVTFSEKLTPAESEVVRVILQFPIVIREATLELSPHFICHYLFSLSQSYNRYYDQHRIIGSDREEQGVVLSKSVSNVLTLGLKLLGIDSPDAI